MMKLLLNMTMDSRTNAVVYRNKANAHACALCTKTKEERV